MSRIGSILATFLLLAPASGQSPPPSLALLTPLERREPDFYGAIRLANQPLQVEFAFGSNPIEFGRDTALTLTIRGAANPSELSRPKLRGRPEFDAIFASIEDGPVQVPTQPGVVSIAYKVRPRNPGQFELPGLKYRFFVLNQPSGKRFQSAFTPVLPFTVQPPPQVLEPVVPLMAPDSYFALPKLEARPVTSPPFPTWHWFALFVGLLMGTLIWIGFWRKRNPDAARLHSIRRTRVVRQALDQLQRADRAPEPIARIEQVLLGYLNERQGLPHHAKTPREVNQELIQRGLSEERVAETVRFLQKLVAARFACHPHAPAAELASCAIRLIESWERSGA
jgi:hypothetical protein